MSADFNTEITINGTHDDFRAILTVMKDLITTNKDIDYHLESVHIITNKDFISTDIINYLKDEELESIISKLNNELCIEASGPYGRFGSLDEVDFFEKLADTAPECSFTGIMSGFNNDGDQAVKGELNNGLLHLYIDYPREDFDMDDDEFGEDDELDEDEEFDDDEFDEDEEFDDENEFNEDDFDDSWDEETIYNPLTKEYIDVEEDDEE